MVAYPLDSETTETGQARSQSFEESRRARSSVPGRLTLSGYSGLLPLTPITFR